MPHKKQTSRSPPLRIPLPFEKAVEGLLGSKPAKPAAKKKARPKKKPGGKASG
jgi:hypothetical protein